MVLVVFCLVQILLQDYDLAPGVLIYVDSYTFCISKTSIFVSLFVHYFSYLSITNVHYFWCSSITIVHYFWYLSITIVHYLCELHPHPLLGFHSSFFHYSSFTRLFFEHSSNILRTFCFLFFEYSCSRIIFEYSLLLLIWILHF